MSQYPPLSKRVYRSTSCTQRVATVSQFRPSTYKNWSKEGMELAHQAVMNDGISVRRAAIEYNVPRSTLRDRVRGSVLPGAVSGNKPYLSSSEEDELVQFLLRCADIGILGEEKTLLPYAVPQYLMLSFLPGTREQLFSVTI